MTFKNIAQETVRSRLSYCIKTGQFTWKNGKNQGLIAGHHKAHGYRVININGFGEFFAHRLAWIYIYGEIPDGLVIDHINGIRSDNRICNLRTATYQQNADNIGAKNTETRLQKNIRLGYIPIKNTLTQLNYLLK